MLLDPNDEDGVCGDAYQEWQNSYYASGVPEWVFESSCNPDEQRVHAWLDAQADDMYDDEQDNEWKCE